MKKRFLVILSALFVCALAVVAFAYNRANTTSHNQMADCPMHRQNATAEHKDSCCGMADCCKDGKCSMGGACCKDKENCSMKQQAQNRTSETGATNAAFARSEGGDCCQPGADCCQGGGACCSRHKKS